MSRDDDKTWAELIDSYHSSPVPDGDQPWPAAEEIEPDDEQPDDFRDASVTLGSLMAGNGPSREPVDVDDEAVDAAEEAAANHFVPPTPAPIPRGDRISRMAWAGVIAPPAGLIIIAIMSWRPPDEIVFLSVVAFIAGFVTLIARMRGHRPGDPGDGAVL